ncbi:MAG: protein kinase domain-containing protein, partial [Thermoplasmata archaeon]
VLSFGLLLLLLDGSQSSFLFIYYPFPVFYFFVSKYNVAMYSVAVAIILWILQLYVYRAGSSSESPQTHVETKPAEIIAEKKPDEVSFTEVKSWPNQFEYARAFQNASFALNSTLKGGKIIRNPNVKMPSNYVYSSGNYGLIFKLEIDGKYYALKCFTKGSDLHRKYYEISKYISRKRPGCLTSFEYIDNAVRTIKEPEKFYPALKMEWIDGDTLYDYIRKNLEDPKALRNIGNQFIKSVYELQKAGIAHGDLSNDNILVNGGKIFFVDYDGMYVPAFKGMKASENGHENFQHPGRTFNDYSEKLDSFSALVIYTGIYALSIDPGLWKFNDDDPDALLFRKKDFIDTKHSPVFAALSAKKGKTQKLASEIKKALASGPEYSIDLPKLIGLKL